MVYRIGHLNIDCEQADIQKLDMWVAFFSDIRPLNMNQQVLGVETLLLPHDQILTVCLTDQQHDLFLALYDRHHRVLESDCRFDDIKRIPFFAMEQLLEDIKHIKNHSVTQDAPYIVKLWGAAIPKIRQAEHREEQTVLDYIDRKIAWISRPIPDNFAQADVLASLNNRNLDYLKSFKYKLQESASREHNKIYTGLALRVLSNMDTSLELNETMSRDFENGAHYQQIRQIIR